MTKLGNYKKRKILGTSILTTSIVVVVSLSAPFGAGVIYAMICGTAAVIPTAMMMQRPLDYASAFYAVLPTWKDGWLAFCIWIALSAFVVIVLAVHQRSKNTSRNVNDGVLGDSRLIAAKSALKTKNDYWNGSLAPKQASLVLGAHSKGYFFDASVPHALIVGKTGSGKSQFMVLETLHLLMAAGWNFIATGKSELVELTGGRAKDERYNRVIFDLNRYPGASCYNPLDLVAAYAESGNTDAAQKAARQVSADLIPLTGGSNDYFPRAARSALTSIILIVVFAEIERALKNMTSVCAIINRGTTAEGKDPSAPLKSYIKELGHAHPAFAPASEFLSDGGVTVAGKNVLSNLKEALSIFNDEGIRLMTATSDVSMQNLVREKTALYVHLLEEGDPYNVLFTCFFNQYWRVSQEMAAQGAGRLPHKTAIVGDEWGNLGKVECLGEIVTLGRSMGLHAWLFVQNLSQLNKYNRPGDDGAGREKILGSMGTKVALSLGSVEDFKYFTQLCGKHTMKTRGQSEQKSSDARGSTGQSYSETAVDLIHEWEWQLRIPSRDGSIVVKGGENSKPGREGVFQMPLTNASKTPAGAYFGLGTQDEEAIKRMAFRTEMERRDNTSKEAVFAWCPDFEDRTGNSSSADSAEADEFSAWNEV